MKYAKVIDGNVSIGLPSTGKLKDGSTVSGYNLIDADILRGEGWLPFEEIRPDYNKETQYLEFSGYDITEEQINAVYIVKDIVIDIDALKQTKILEIKVACNTEILNGFDSSAHDGVTLEHYNLEYEDQINIMGLKNDIKQGLIAEGTLTYYASGEPCEPWTNDQFLKLYDEAMEFKRERVTRAKTLIDQVQNAGTKENIEVIMW